MKKSLLLAALCGLSLTATGLFGQAVTKGSSYEYSMEGLRLTAGFGYRNFRQAEFSHAQASGLTGILSYDGSRVGTLEDFKASLPQSVVGNRQVEMNTVKFSGGSVSTHDGYSARESSGLTLGAAYGLYDDESLSIDLVGNLSYYHIDSADRGMVSGNEVTDRRIVANGNFGNPSEVIYSESTRHMAGRVSSKFDMRLWTIDLGLSVSYALDSNVNLYLAAGPTFSLANMESSSYAVTSAVSNPAFAAGKGGHDNEIEFEWGLYASAGASYMFTEQLGMALELRYDEAFGTVGTKYVKQDLDSWGGVLKLIYQF